jgi:hypothetical protein
LNRHDAKVAKDRVFMTSPRTRLKKYSWGGQEFGSLSPESPFGLGVLGALAVDNFGLGFIACQSGIGCFAQLWCQGTGPPIEWL